MARCRTVADQECIEQEVRAHIGDGIQIQKTMRCGHTDWVFNPLIRHSDLGDVECCGCIVPRYHGSEADLVCNECGLFFKTVAAADVAARLTELSPAMEICKATCPHCGGHNVFAGLSSMIAFSCRHCGKGVVI